MIENNKWYSVTEIRAFGEFPLDTDYKIKKFIDAGLLNGNSIGKGNGKRYFVKGENVIKFLAKFEAGDFN